jgi:hypothetical protein
MSDERAVYDLMIEALEANEEVARLQKPFVAGINRGSTASQEVIQEASDRLGAAQRRWWDLRTRALAAARAHPCSESVDAENQRLRQTLAGIATLATQGIDTQYAGRILREIEDRARTASGQGGEGCDAND